MIGEADLQCRKQQLERASLLLRFCFSCFRLYGYDRGTRDDRERGGGGRCVSFPLDRSRFEDSFFLETRCDRGHAGRECRDGGRPLHAPWAVHERRARRSRISINCNCVTSGIDLFAHLDAYAVDSRHIGSGERSIASQKIVVNSYFFLKTHFSRFTPFPRPGRTKK